MLHVEERALDFNAGATTSWEIWTHRLTAKASSEVVCSWGFTFMIFKNVSHLAIVAHLVEHQPVH